MSDPLTVKDLQLIKLPAGLEVFDGKGDVVARVHLHHPGTGLKVGEAAAGRLAHDDSGGGGQDLIHGTCH